MVFCDVALVCAQGILNPTCSQFQPTEALTKDAKKIMEIQNLGCLNGAKISLVIYKRMYRVLYFLYLKSFLKFYS